MGGGIYFPPDTDLSELLQDSVVTKLIIGTGTKIDFRGDWTSKDISCEFVYNSYNSLIHVFESLIIHGAENLSFQLE